VPCYAGYTKEVENVTSLDWAKVAPAQCRYRSFKNLWEQSSEWKTFGGGSTASEELWTSGALRVPLMFHVSGSAKDSAEGSDGRLSIVMSWRNESSSGVKELGGRVLGAGTSGNLIPRGLGRQDINPNILGRYASYGDELSLYEELPLIPHDARVTIHFYLETTNGLPIKWTGNTLKVFYPQFTFVHEKSNCGYTSHPKACIEKPKAAPIDFISLQEGAPLRVRPIGSDRCSTNERTDAETSEQEALRKVSDAIRSGEVPVPKSFAVKVPTDRAVCAPQISTVSCATATTSEYLEGCEPPALALQAASVCQVTRQGLQGVKVINVTTEEPIKRVQRTRGCSDAALPACARAFARVVENISYYPSTGEQAQCDVSEITQGANVIFGPFIASQCGDRISEIANLYRANEKIPHDVPVSVVRVPAPSLYSREKPGGSCVAYQAATADSGEMVCGLNISSVAAERCCEESGGRCRRREIVTSGTGAATGWEAGLLAAAQQRVVDAVQAAYPPARAQDGCGSEDADCLQATATIGKGADTATVSAKVHVPLRLLRAIGSPHVTVEHSVTRRMEKAHLG
jgi:hypothetical protein